jgi:hypothetical protein
MSLDTNPSQQTPICKIKAVNPPFRSVSTLRETKDLPVVGPVNPTTAPGQSPEPGSASEWSAERLGERLRLELSPRSCRRLVRAGTGRGASVEHLLRSALSEVA